MNPADPNCRQCERHGLNYPDGTRACARHTPPQWRERLADLDHRRAKIAPEGWPYGPNIDVQARVNLIEWADPLGVKLSSTRCQELHWLRTGRCQHADCRPLRWMDHTTRWSLNGKPALLLTQPYGDLEGHREAMGNILEDDELHVETKPSWYGHGTTGIFVWRVDAWRELQ